MLEVSLQLINAMFSASKTPPTAFTFDGHGFKMKTITESTSDKQVRVFSGRVMQTINDGPKRGKKNNKQECDIIISATETVKSVTETHIGLF